MGITGLNKFLLQYSPNSIKDINTFQLKDKIVIIDVSIFLYQFASAIKSSTDDLKTSTGKIITHVHAILSKTLTLTNSKKLKIIYVFDGKPTNLKQGTLDTRKSTKNDANKEIKEIKIKIKEIEEKLEPVPVTVQDVQEQIQNITQVKELQEQIIKLKKRSVTVTHKQMEECKEIIELLGIPMIQSLEEADSQCAWLVKNGLGDYVASEDMDILTFGTPKLIRKLSAKDTVTEYNLEVILKELELNQDEFIDLCILLGCDYTPTIDKIGPKKAYELIKKHRSIDKIIELDPGFTTGKYQIPKNFNYKEAREYFKNPPVKHIQKEDLVWSIPKYDELKELLKTKYEYSDDNIQKLFGVLKGGYYSVISGEKTTGQYYKDKKAYLKQLRSNINFDSDSD
jgi:flap endonuclease-1